MSSRAYRVYNKRTGIVMELVNAVVGDNLSSVSISEKRGVEEIVDLEERGVNTRKENEESTTLKPRMLSKDPSSRLILNHPKKNMLRSLEKGKRLRSRVVNQVSYMCYLSQAELKNIEEAQKDESWIEPMHEELHQFT